MSSADILNRKINLYLIFFYSFVNIYISNKIL